MSSKAVFVPKMNFSLAQKHFIVSYHYVRPKENGIYPCPPEEFERQIKFLAENYRLTGVKEVLNAAQTGSGEKLCALTFDDGTKDHYLNAKPVLLKWGAIATFFPIGGVFDGLLPFVHRVHILLAHFAVLDLIDNFNAFLKELFPQLLAGLLIPTDHRRLGTTRNDYGGDFRIDNFKETMALAPAEVRERFIDKRLADLNLSPADLKKQMFMSETEVRDLHRLGFFIGNHTYHHVPVDQLSIGEFKEELRRAGTRLQAILGEKPSIFSYPWGRSSPVTRESLRQAGFSCAVTIERRAVAGVDDPFLLPRYDTNDIRNFLNRR